ncbi:hypothetical protein EV639_1052 [Rathayibacter tanaceti]|uniref:Large exoprotein n=2 Tax=Rathayibacter tanaceti TaxID=1671680 RepID=A0AAE6RKW2_9MICO|nr:hypothetical protein [Rathayibacter tanaceti]QHC56086.1 hypothetical protein GSU10_10895 [Rathayibacter tanaceti]TCO36919.1 hypothetical protein EV639_1052 [Rathayibacter tanaceti]
MSSDWLGGGVVWALAAVLWVAYLIPTWMRRRSYNATERNAVRLQQTLRILAETAEVPEHVRAEATAREVALQQRRLRVTETRRRAEEKAQAMELAQAEKAAREALRRATAGARRSTRRSALRWRQGAALTVLVGLLGALVGLVMLPFGGTGAVPLVGLLLLAAGLGTLIVLAPGRCRAAAPAAVATTAVTAERRRAEVFEAELDVEEADDASEELVEDRASWTPQPLPKPLYLSRGTVAASAMASIDAVERLRTAAAEAELAQRAAATAPEVAPLRAPRAAAPDPEAPRPSSRFASMGVVDGVDAIDLDQALQRRRGA